MITRLAALPRKQRAAVVLRYYAAMSDADIAVELGCREITSVSGTRGMYVLELDKNVAMCGTTAETVESDGRILQTPTPLPCPHLTAQADGSKLKVDPNFSDGPPDGLMNDAILSRPDGWQISLYTANVQAKYYGAPVLGSVPALTVEQVTDVVTSPEWLAK